MTYTFEFDTGVFVKRLFRQHTEITDVLVAGVSPRCEKFTFRKITLRILLLLGDSATVFGLQGL